MQLIEAKALTEKPSERGAQNKSAWNKWLEANVIIKKQLF